MTFPTDISNIMLHLSKTTSFSSCIFPIHEDWSNYYYYYYYYSISFATLCGFWISQQGHSKPSYSMPVLSNFYLDRIYFMKSLDFRHLWLILAGPLQNEKNRVCYVYTDPPYFPNGPTGCTSVSESGTSLNVLASDIKSCGSDCRNQQRAFLQPSFWFRDANDNSRTSTLYYRKLQRQETNKAWRAEGLCLPSVRLSHTLRYKHLMFIQLKFTNMMALYSVIFFQIILLFDNE
jgi:hypothetical protein